MEQCKEVCMYFCNALWDLCVKKHLEKNVVARNNPGEVIFFIRSTQNESMTNNAKELLEANSMTLEQEFYKKFRANLPKRDIA